VAGRRQSPDRDRADALQKSSYFNVLNRNKRGITLDLTTADA